MHLSLSGKFFLVFALLITLFLSINLFTLSRMQAFGDRIEQLHGRMLHLPEWSADQRGHLKTLDQMLEQMESEENAQQKIPAKWMERILNDLKHGFEQGKTAFISGDEPEIRRLNTTFDALYDESQSLVDAGRLALQNQSLQMSRPRLQLRQRIRSLSKGLSQFALQSEESIHLFSQRIGQEEADVFQKIMFILTASAILGLLLLGYMAKKLSPIKDLSKAVSKLAEGDTQIGWLSAVSFEPDLNILKEDLLRLAQSLNDRDQKLSAQQRELVNQERLATVGRMTSQMTHELRNPLSSIGLNSELLMDELVEGATNENVEAARGLLKSITHEVERLREITEEYLRYARLPRPELKPVDLNHLAQELIEFMQSELEAAKIRARLDADRAGRSAFVDPNQIRAALMNLMRNAREAMGKEGGHIVVSIRTLGDKVALSVKDDGPGMPKEAMDHLFEPFFSTKPQGTGLGLSMVQQIVKAQQGDITIDSHKQGTTVTLTLPAVDEGVDCEE